MKENAWLINEPRKKRSGRKTKRKGVTKMAKKKRKAAKKRSKKRTYAHNPPVKRRRRSSGKRKASGRRYRRNPVSIGSKAGLNHILWAGAGFIGTKFAGNMIAPAIGMTQPIMRMGIKTVIAMAGGRFIVSRFAGRTAGENFMVGGLVEVISDVVKTYLAPSVPALAQYDEPLELDSYNYSELEAYPAGMTQEMEEYDETYG